MGAKKVTELVKEYIRRKDDFEYVYEMHGKVSHYSKESRRSVSSNYDHAKKELEKASPGMVEVIDRLISKQDHKMEKELGDLKRSMNLYHDAESRARKIWQNVHPDKKHTWPDKCKMSLWFLEQLDEKNKEIEELKKQG